MLIHLPIAEMSVVAEQIIALGAAVGFLSGIFGVGGGFLTTPFLIFMGLPPAVAVGTQSCQLVASSVTGTLGHLRRGNVDLHIGFVMLIGGLIGSILGIGIFRILQHFGQIDFTLAVLYVLFLGGVGGAMLIESALALIAQYSRRVKAWLIRRQETQTLFSFFETLPWQTDFARSRLRVSVLVPGGIGFVGGILVSIMGIGGGFLLVPAMIYILGMPTLLVAGTSLLQIAATSAFSTVLHASANGTVDALLAALLISGGLIGTRFGVWTARFLTGATARIALALLVLSVAVIMGQDMVIEPKNLFSFTVRGT